MLILAGIIRIAKMMEVVEGDGGQNREGEQFRYNERHGSGPKKG